MSSPDNERPLSGEELAALRQMMESDRRAKWVWATLRVWAGWVTGAVALYFAGKSFLMDIFSRFPK